MAEEDEYEGIPHAPLWITASAGACAGLAEHLTLYPIDSVKTRMQSLCPCPQRKFRTPWGGLKAMIISEGWWRPFRGISAAAIGAGPAHALYFSVYEQSRRFLTQGRFGHNQSLAYGASGVLATLVHDAFMNPTDVVKQRMQMWGSPYQGSIQCLRCIWKAEGMAALYRSYPTQLALNIPFQSIHFMTYEAGQEFLNPNRTYRASAHLLAGGVAGGVAAAVTTPLDVLKTVLNTQQSAAPILYNPSDGRPCPVTSAPSPSTVHLSPPGELRVSFPSVRVAAMEVWRSRGFLGFFSGAQARVISQAPATAISWCIYETAKFLLHSSGMLPSESPPVTAASTSTSSASTSSTSQLLQPIEFQWSETVVENGWSQVTDLK